MFALVSYCYLLKLRLQLCSRTFIGNAITSPRRESIGSNVQQRVKYISERFSTLGLKVVLPTMRQNVLLSPLAQRLRLPQLRNKTLSVHQSTKLKALK